MKAMKFIRAHWYRGLPKKDEKSETTLRNIFCLFPYIYCSIVSLKSFMSSLQSHSLWVNLVWKENNHATSVKQHESDTWTIWTVWMCSERPTPGFTRKDLVLSSFSRVFIYLSIILFSNFSICILLERMDTGQWTRLSSKLG